MAGSLHQDKKTKKWYYMLELGRDDLGKRKQKKKGGFKTKSDAKLALAQAEIELSQGTYVEPSVLTLNSFMEEWLTERKNSVRESTHLTNCRFFKDYIKPHIGNITLAELKPLHVQRLINKLMNEYNLGAATVRKTIGILAKGLQKAVKFKLIRENPVDIVDKPKVEHKPAEVWDIDQINEFLQKAKSRHNYIGYLICLSSGVRKGELLGLCWKDVDLENGVIYITQSLSSTGKFENVKTKSSIRSIHLPQVTVDELKQHYEKYLQEKELKGKTWNPHDLVVCSKNGTPVDHKNFLRGFKRAVKSVGLPEIRVHDLRHSHATSLLSKNVHPKLVQERLGHSKIGITLDTYSHVLPNMQKEVAEKLDDFLEV